jgi:hypothetical protein
MNEYSLESRVDSLQRILEKEPVGSRIYRDAQQRLKGIRLAVRCLSSQPSTLAIQYELCHTEEKLNDE